MRGEVSTKWEMRSRFRKMHQRCYDPECEYYYNYGGRGIYVCPEWHDFENYFAHFGCLPKGVTIDRINNDGPYSPENCRLATMKEQSRNRRTARLLELNGVVMSMIEWSEKTGIDRKTIAHRLKGGWSVEDALTVPVKRIRYHLRFHKEEQNV
jgi:hypothetical protein